MKRAAVSVLCAALALAALFVLVSCSGGTDGTYYMYLSGEECDRNSYIKIEGDRWSDEEGVGGACTVDGENVSFYYVVDAGTPTGANLIASGLATDGRTVELMAGTIRGGKLTITKSVGLSLGNQALIAYKDGKVK